MREGWFLLRLHSSLRSVPLLLGHFRADGDRAREVVELWVFQGVFRGQASEVGRLDRRGWW